jgi:hypothetical protein
MAFCFTTEGNFSCALATPPRILPFSSPQIGGLEFAAAHEVIGVVDELLMNPINFHVDDPSLLINGRAD